MRSAFVPVLILLVGLAGPGLAQPAISVSARAVSVSGVTPGGQVVWFGVAREIREHSATLVRLDDVGADEDKDGTVRWELNREVAPVSIWVAVDLATGVAALATPEGFPLNRIELPGRGVVPGGGKPDWVEVDRSFVELLVVRPGVGAWGGTLGDGGEGDDDGAYDGRLVASLARLRGLKGSPAAPERFGPKDLVVIIDPDRMEVAVRRLAEVPR